MICEIQCRHLVYERPFYELLFVVLNDSNRPHGWRYKQFSVAGKEVDYDIQKYYIFAYSGRDNKNIVSFRTNVLRDKIN